MFSIFCETTWQPYPSLEVLLLLHLFLSCFASSPQASPRSTSSCRCSALSPPLPTPAPSPRFCPHSTSSCPLCTLPQALLPTASHSPSCFHRPLLPSLGFPRLCPCCSGLCRGSQLRNPLLSPVTYISTNPTCPQRCSSPPGSLPQPSVMALTAFAWLDHRAPAACLLQAF